MSSSEKSEHAGILKNASILSLSLAVTMVLSLGLRMYLPRLLGPEKIGIFYFAESYALIFFSFLPLGISVYINRYIPPNPDHSGEILPSLLVVEFLYGLIIMLALFLSLYFTDKSNELVITTLLMGVFAGLMTFHRSIIKEIFIARNEVRLVSLSNILTKVVLVGTAFSLLYFSKEVYVVAIAFMISELFAACFLLYASYKRDLLSHGYSKTHTKKMLAIGLPFYISHVLTSIGSEVDMTMLGTISNSTEVGYFGSASKLIGVFLLFVPIINNSITPALSRAYANDDGSFEGLARNGFHFLLIVTFPLSIILGFLGPDIASFLYGVGFENSYQIIVYLAPSLALIYINTMLGTGIRLDISGKVLAFITSISILSNVILNWIFIPVGIEYWGAGGGGLAVTLTTVFSEVIMACLFLYFYPARILTVGVAWIIFIVLLPSILSLIFYNEITQIDFFIRLGIISMSPIYLILTGAVRISQIKMFFEQLKASRHL